MQFHEIVAAALDELPAELAAGLRNVAVVIEDRNPDDPDIYGLFEGFPITDGVPGIGGHRRASKPDRDLSATT